MKRLTIRKADGSLIQPDNASWTEIFVKLAQYEDTGFEPDEVHEALERYKELRDSANNPETKPARWVRFTDENGNEKRKCNSCGKVIGLTSAKTKYCSNCGSLMINGASDPQ